jgi:hypothetical protein
VSWVSRRLQLLSGLPDGALAAVCEGRLSSWAASRVVAPLARANSEHADQLVKALSVAPMSTRELRSWFEHYQKASRIARQRLVSHPHLFLAVLEESIEQCMSERLRDGPEGGTAARNGSGQLHVPRRLHGRMDAQLCHLALISCVPIISPTRRQRSSLPLFR